MTEPFRSDNTRHFQFKAPEGLTIESRIRVGRRSQWFAARQTSLDRKVALKCLRPLLTLSHVFREAFFEAARQASVIVHSAALPIISIHPEENCIAMQWTAGKPLSDLAGSLDKLSAVRIGEAVL
ncbi:MAG: hypothetical protein FWG74_04225, partial [Planctomycetes bacterium]|nr:hypothetical protein [Planctomycetota bacterium]